MLLFPGTRVIRVFATDEDGTGPNGQIAYSIVSTNNKFVIDPNTGWLTTNAVSFLLGHYFASFMRMTIWNIYQELKLRDIPSNEQGVPRGWMVTRCHLAEIFDVSRKLDLFSC